jgi:hypothetical protein
VRTAAIGVRDLSLHLRSSGARGLRRIAAGGRIAQVRGLGAGIADFIGRPVPRRGAVHRLQPGAGGGSAEYIQSLGDGGRDLHAGMNTGHDDLAAAARERLLRWDVPASLLDDLARTRRGARRRCRCWPRSAA